MLDRIDMAGEWVLSWLAGAFWRMWAHCNRWSLMCWKRRNRRRGCRWSPDSPF
jgi:hypothetical protein